MTEPFPSKAYQELCIEKRDELPEWEPRFGDYVIAKESKHTAIVLHSQPEQLGWGEEALETDMVYLLFFPGVLEKMMVSGIGESWGAPVIKYRKVDVIPLPTQRQLIEMIEERGYEWMLWRRGLMQFYRCEFKKDGKPPIERTEGPDPETALLRCLLAMMQYTVPTQGEKEEKDGLCENDSRA